MIMLSVSRLYVTRVYCDKNITARITRFLPERDCCRNSVCRLSVVVCYVRAPQCQMAQINHCAGCTMGGVPAARNLRPCANFTTRFGV